MSTSISKFDDLEKNVIKCYSEEYFGIDVQMQVVDVEL